VATVLLLRHGRTTANAAGGLAGRQPVELDDHGRDQAHRVGERLRKLPLAAVVTSPLTRCRQTLDLALPEYVPAVDEGLIECGYGDWEGRPLKELAEDPLWPVVQLHPSAVVFPNGEAMAEMSARAVAAVRR
jgi:probable phosphomutase (TIGR03848 family)